MAELLPEGFADQIDAALEAIPDYTAEAPTEAHELAALYVKAKRRSRAVSAEDKKAKALAASLEAPILAAMREGRWPISANVEGANLHRKQVVYVAPPSIEVAGEKVRDHDAVTTAIREWIEAHPDDPTNWASLLPSTVNSNSLRGTVNDYLREHDFTDEERMLPIVERLKVAGFPAPLLEVLDIAEDYTINANGL